MYPYPKPERSIFLKRSAFALGIMLVILTLGLYLLSGTIHQVADQQITAYIEKINKRHNLGISVGKQSFDGTSLFLQHVEIKRPLAVKISAVSIDVDLLRLNEGVRALTSINAAEVTGHHLDHPFSIEQLQIANAREKMRLDLTGVAWGEVFYATQTHIELSQVDIDIAAESFSLQFAQSSPELVLRHKLLSYDPIAVPHFISSGKVLFAGSELLIDDLTAQAFGAEIHGQLKVDHFGEERATAVVSLQAPSQGCQNIHRELAGVVAPSLDKFTLSGTVGGGLSASIPLGKPEAFTQSNNINFACQITRIPADVRARLSSPETSSGPSTTFTPLHMVAAEAITAILAAEDIGFFRHNGFEFDLIEEALRKNLAEKRTVLGGSTISMQTAKNLFLSGKRTIQRKLKEAFLTWMLESRISKERILEIYLNIIEYGPGIIGIAKASQHFFSKTPKDLNLVEATFLGTLLPAPKSRYAQFCRGKVSESYRRFIDARLETMRTLEQIGPEEFEGAKKQILTFHTPNRRRSRHCRPYLATTKYP